MKEFKTALDMTNTFLSLKIFEALMEEDLTNKDRAKIIAEGFAQLESKYPDLKNVSTKTDLSETELRLMKEIEATRLQIKDMDIKFSKDMKEMEIKLSKDIAETRVEIKETKSDLLKWSFAFWISQIGVIAGIGFFVYKAVNLG
jgi:hypothetical protein